MASHTDRAAVTSYVVGSTRLYRALVSMIVAVTIALTGWTAAQAAAVNTVLEGRGTQHPSLRQLERAGTVVAQQNPSIRQAEHAAELRADQLRRMEYNELRRFRNRAPASALPALDAEIERLRSVLVGDVGA